jgi:hypothetical protein
MSSAEIMDNSDGRNWNYHALRRICPPNFFFLFSRASNDLVARYVRAWKSGVCLIGCRLGTTDHSYPFGHTAGLPATLHILTCLTLFCYVEFPLSDPTTVSPFPRLIKILIWRVVTLPPLRLPILVVRLLTVYLETVVTVSAVHIFTTIITKLNCTLCLNIVTLLTPAQVRVCGSLYDTVGARCSVVVEALCYKPEGRGFETRWGEWIFFFNLPNPSGRTRPWGLLSL